MRDGGSYYNFISAMTLTLTLATSEGWAEAMQASSVQPPFCGARAGYLPPHADSDHFDCGVESLSISAASGIRIPRSLKHTASKPRTA